MSEIKLMKFKGATIKLAGEEHILPPLSPFAYAKNNAAQKIQRIRDEADEMRATSRLGSLSPETFSYLIELVWLALKRNYPDITEEEVGNGVADGMELMGMMQYLISQDEKVQKEIEKEKAKNVQRHSTETAK